MIKNETFHLHDKTIHVKMNQPLLNSDFSTNSKKNTDLQTYFNIFHDKKKHEISAQPLWFKITDVEHLFIFKPI